MNRVFIYTKDIQLITGKGERQCRDIIRKIKKQHHKKDHQPITVYDVCEFFGLPIEEILPLLR